MTVDNEITLFRNFRFRNNQQSWNEGADRSLPRREFGIPRQDERLGES